MALVILASACGGSSEQTAADAVQNATSQTPETVAPEPTAEVPEEEPAGEQEQPVAAAPAASSTSAVEAAAQIAAALEAYGVDSGTYNTPAGFNDTGLGPFQSEGREGYTTSIAGFLLSSGYLTSIPQDPLYATNGEHDHLIYTCADRVGVFSKTDEPANAGAEDWWASNDCTRYPIDTLGRPHLTLSEPLVVLQPLDAAREIVTALEAFGSVEGTYNTPAGFNDTGEGPFQLEGPNGYKRSIANMLRSEGYLAFIPRDPNYRIDATFDQLIYTCEDRVGVFTKTDEPTDPESATWWADNDCTRYPIETLQRPHLTLSEPLPN